MEREKKQMFVLILALIVGFAVGSTTQNDVQADNPRPCWQCYGAQYWSQGYPCAPGQWGLWTETGNYDPFMNCITTNCLDKNLGCGPPDP